MDGYKSGGKVAGERGPRVGPILLKDLTANRNGIENWDFKRDGMPIPTYSVVKCSSKSI